VAARSGRPPCWPNLWANTGFARGCFASLSMTGFPCQTTQDATFKCISLLNEPLIEVTPAENTARSMWFLRVNRESP
jgi:hypothetical protein